MAKETIRVKGLRELNRAFSRMSGDLKKELRQDLMVAAEIVATEARARFSPVSSASAAGFRARVRGVSRVVVEQSKRRTTGKHPEYGVLQMKTALLPSLQHKERAVIEQVDRTLDRLGRDFEKGI